MPKPLTCLGLLSLLAAIIRASALPATDVHPTGIRRFNCPFQDNLGFKANEIKYPPALASRALEDELVCAFHPDRGTIDENKGSTNALSFHCVYSVVSGLRRTMRRGGSTHVGFMAFQTTGELTRDWNMGGCPIQAPRAPLTLNRRNTLPRSPVVRGLRKVDVRRDLMQTRKRLGVGKMKKRDLVTPE